MEKFINEGISPTLWGIRRTDDELFDKTLIGLANIDNDLNNKCIQEINSNDNPIESKAIGLENFAINGDIFSDTLIAWSTKQMMENEAVENIKSNLESYIDTLSSNRVNKIEIN
jgi:myo-inositol catabolism protein IolC